MPATYVPPASANDPDFAEAWAQKLDSPGGMADISRDIKTVEMSFDNDRSTLQSQDRAERRAEREQQRARASGEQPSGLGEDDLQPGGNPAVAALASGQPRRTGQIRPFMDTANPAISGVPRREFAFYFMASCVGKACASDRARRAHAPTARRASGVKSSTAGTPSSRPGRKAHNCSLSGGTAGVSPARAEA